MGLKISKQNEVYVATFIATLSAWSPRLLCDSQHLHDFVPADDINPDRVQPSKGNDEEEYMTTRSIHQLEIVILKQLGSHAYLIEQ